MIGDMGTNAAYIGLVQPAVEIQNFQLSHPGCMKKT